MRRGWDSETSGKQSISHGKPYKMHFLVYFTLQLKLIMLETLHKVEYLENHVRLAGSHRLVSWFPGSAKASPGNQETRRRDQLVPQTIDHGLPFSPVNYLFEIYLFHTINSICFQMLCYSRWVRHVCFGINGPITAQLSNGPWQRSGIA